MATYIRFAATTHEFGKQNMVTIRDRAGYHDKYKCELCGLEGKRFGLDDHVTIAGNRKASNDCPNAKPEAKPKTPSVTRIRITNCGALGPQFANLTEGSEHKVVATPKTQQGKNENGDRGYWVLGAENEKVLVLHGEYKVVKDA